MCDNIQVDCFSYHLHAIEQIRGYRAYYDAVMVVIQRLYFRQIGFDGFIFLPTYIGKKNRLLN